MKKVILGISGGISFLLFLILLLVSNILGRSQPEQTFAERWSKEKDVSQVSCFFSVNEPVDEDRIMEFEHSIDSALTDAGVVLDSENPGARLWVDAYSAPGRVTISSDRSSLEAEAIGIGGDFFLFHPLKLLSGAYFSGNDLMQDYCIIDQDVAWQLFGSNNVAGMNVYIGGVPHIVTGVIQRQEGRLEEAAGLDGAVVYLSYQTLNELEKKKDYTLNVLGRNLGINHYEVLMPDPVTGFAYNYVKEKLGSSEKETVVVENTSRYSFFSRLKRLTEFGTRSMNGKSIVYPYWENIARGYEDILTVVTLGELLFLSYAVALVLIFFILWWKRKGWTVKDKVLLLKDKAERQSDRLRARRRAEKGDPDALVYLEEFDGKPLKRPKQEGEKPERGKRKRKAREAKPEPGERKRKARGEKPEPGERKRKDREEKPEPGERKRKDREEKPERGNRKHRDLNGELREPKAAEKPEEDSFWDDMEVMLPEEPEDAASKGAEEREEKL